MHWTAALALASAAGLGAACDSDRAPREDAGAMDARRDTSSAEASASADAGPCGDLPPVTLVSHTSPSLAVGGDPGAPPDAGPPLGIYDPSIVYPAGAPSGVLSYSTVSPNDVHTRVAVSTERGRSFTFVAEPNVSAPATITTTDTTVCGGTTCAAVLWHEVSSIVADPGDPDANAAFKLFVHTYASLAGGSDLRRDWGYIGLYTAAQPSGPWSAERPLLGWRSSATISTAGVAQALTSTSALSDCVAFTEPGAILTSQGLDLAITCVSSSGGQPSNRVVLLRSTDHAASFAYVSTLLSTKDEACLAATTSMVNGPDLFVAGGTEYLIVTPIAPVTPTGTNYAGCMTIPIADVASGTVARTASGAPQVLRWIAADDGRFTGPCSFAEGATAAGYLVPMVSQPPPPDYHIFATGLAL